MGKILPYESIVLIQSITIQWVILTHIIEYLRKDFHDLFKHKRFDIFIYNWNSLSNKEVVSHLYLMQFNQVFGRSWIKYDSSKNREISNLRSMMQNVHTINNTWQDETSIHFVIPKVEQDWMSLYALWVNHFDNVPIYWKDTYYSVETSRIKCIEYKQE